MSASSDNSIRLVYSSETDKDDKKYFFWSIHIETSAANLDLIKQVIYTLHPTFSRREVPLENREEGFKLYARGWGEFNLKIEIVRNDNKKMRIDYLVSRKEYDEISKPIDFS